MAKSYKTVKKQSNILTNKITKANWIGYILLRDRLLKHVTEGQLQERSDTKTKKTTWAATGW
jgi:hypothetical protein